MMKARKSTIKGHADLNNNLLRKSVVAYLDGDESKAEFPDTRSTRDEESYKFD